MNKKKLIVVGVLGVLLLAVLMWNPGSSDSGKSEPAPAVSSDTKSGPATVAAPAPKKDAAKPAAPQTVVWPEVDLKDAEALNPFEREKPKPAETADAGETPEDPGAASKAVGSAVEVQSAVEARRIRMICRTSKGMTALVGSQLVKVGDVLDGARVAEIRPDGITLEPLSE